MDVEEARRVLHAGLDELEKDPSRWGEGAYFQFRPHGWCMCLFGAAYCVQKYGKLPVSISPIEEERELDDFMLEFVNLLSLERPGSHGVVDPLIDANDALKANGKPLARLREEVDLILGPR